MLRRALLALVACVALGGSAFMAAAAQAETGGTLNVWGTSDITDSHMLGEIEKGFTKEEEGVPLSERFNINYTAVGSGAAITHVIEEEKGEGAGEGKAKVDLVIVHSPPVEEKLWGTIAGGPYSLEARGRSIFYNSYVVAGSTTDPVGVEANHHENVIEAFYAIALAGKAGHATFLTRNDESGTNVKEQEIWFEVAEAHPGMIEMESAGTKRDRPKSTETWYDTQGNSHPTQGNSLRNTNTCAEGAGAGNGCYTLVDKGTFSWLAGGGGPDEIPDLKPVVEGSEASLPNKQGELTNPFHAYLLKGSPHPEGAKRLMNFLVSKKFQEETVPSFPAPGENGFEPDAFPSIASSSIPTSSAPGGKINIGAKFVYPPPVAKPIEGMSVHLMESVGCTGTYVAASVSPQTTSASGEVEFKEVLFSGGFGATCYALKTEDYVDTALNTLFTENLNKKLGANEGKVL